MDTSKLNDLQEAYDAAKKAQKDHEDRYHKRQSELMVELNQKLHDEFQAEWEPIIKAACEAEKALNAEQDRIRQAMSEASILFPVGTILCHWDYTDRWSSNAPTRPDGKKAVLEIYKDGDPLPENCKYHKPSHGDIILRMLSKDGKPGKKFEVWRTGPYDSHLKEWWLPEGVQHPRAKKE